MSTSWFDNPIVRQQERQRKSGIMRSPLLPLLVACAAVLSGIGGSLAAGSFDTANVGAGLWNTFVVGALYSLALLGAVRGAHSVALEHNGRTWEALLLTGIAPRRLISGKFVALFTESLNFLVMLLPLGAVALAFGGVHPLDMLGGLLLLLGATATAVAAGLAVGIALPQFGVVIAVAMGTAIASSLLGLLGMLPLVSSLLLGDGYGARNWWSQALLSGEFSVEYLFYLLLGPLYLLAVPAWLMFEWAVASANEFGSDRMWSLKRAALLSLGLMVLLALPALAFASSRESLEITAAALALPMLTLFGLGTLFTADDLYPLRRARLELQAAPAWRRALLPPSALRAVVGYVGSWCLAALLLSGVAYLVAARFGFRSDDPLERIVLATASGVPYVALYTSFELSLRCGGRSPWAARLLSGLAQIAVHVVLLMLLIVVLAATRFDGSDDFEQVGPALFGPSVALPMAMLVGMNQSARPALFAGALLAGVLQLVLSALLLLRAARRTAEAARAEEATEARFDAALHAEAQQRALDAASHAHAQGDATP